MSKELSNGTKTRATRPGNNRHPAIAAGVVAPTRKRRTKAEIKADAEAKNAAKLAAEEAKLAKIQHIAVLEDDIAREDSVDNTPRPRAPSACPVQGKPLQRTKCVLDIDSDTTDTRDNCLSESDFVVGQEVGSGEGSGEGDTEVEEGDTDTEEEARPKKKAKASKPKPKAKSKEKAKTSKPSVRDAIDKARNDLATVSRSLPTEKGAHL